ncbi:unnamed protein product (macronuclear) [Paramecium tetraurelia]|uniref:Transmembrane protein n=1 Tax=Paramecium tetraurelia TaxID=5888 RepID=A0ECS2_PARTE|nr:uncharacterized protein GSPATT00003958001 [Paramecium tetraurelia]CAK93089.1 unnamed protein product [Paramecium tetraurelia]|eukprot:XP_001460486.1 hypothetical protein (macronuclear) [Paramecium tetraurelia strain d4-2]
MQSRQARNSLFLYLMFLVQIISQTFEQLIQFRLLQTQICLQTIQLRNSEGRPSLNNQQDQLYSYPVIQFLLYIKYVAANNQSQKYKNRKSILQLMASLILLKYKAKKMNSDNICMKYSIEKHEQVMQGQNHHTPCILSIFQTLIDLYQALRSKLMKRKLWKLFQNYFVHKSHLIQGFIIIYLIIIKQLHTLFSC